MITKKLTGRIEVESAKGGLSSLLNLLQGAYADVELTLSANHTTQPDGSLYSPFHGGTGLVRVQGKILSVYAKNSTASSALSALLKKKKGDLDLQVPVAGGKSSYVLSDKDIGGLITFQLLSPIAGEVNGLPALQVVIDLKPSGATAYIASEVRCTGTLKQVSTNVTTEDVGTIIGGGKAPTDASPNVAWHWEDTLASFSLSRSEQTMPVSALLTAGTSSFVGSLKRSTTFDYIGGVFRVQVPAGVGRLTLTYGSGHKDVFDIPSLRVAYADIGGVRVAPAAPPSPAPSASGKYVWDEAKARAWLLSRPASFFVKDKDGRKVSPTDPLAVESIRIQGDRVTHFGGGNDGYPVSEEFLWKRNSDSDGKLVVITPHSAWLTGVRIGGETLSKCSIGNGWRAHWRFSKPGQSYSGVIEFLGTDDKLQVPAASQERFSTRIEIAPANGVVVVPPPITPQPSSDKGVFKTLMLTDVAQDLDLSKRGGLEKLAGSYGCFLYLDLQYPLAGGKTARVRPYIGPGRNGGDPTDLLLRNLDYLFKLFRQVIICPLGGR